MRSPSSKVLRVVVCRSCCGRQVSRPLEEKVRFADDRVDAQGTHTARFGEIEQRGISAAGIFQSNLGGTVQKVGSS